MLNLSLEPVAANNAVEQPYAIGTAPERPLGPKDIRFMEFIDPAEHALYEDFRKRDISPSVLGFMLIVQTIGQLFLTVASLNVTMGALFAVFRIMRALAAVPGWILWCSVVWPQKLQWLQRYRLSATNLGNIYIMISVVAMGGTLVFRAAQGPCPDDNDPFTKYNCNPMHEVHSLPQDIIIVIVLAAVIVHIMIKCYTWWVLLFAFMLAFGSILAAIIIANATGAILFLAGHAAVFGILFIYEGNTLRAYMALRNMEHTVRKSLEVENDKLVFEKQSVEMRALMGNVAHDLKTPMQSFVMDLEGLEKLIQPYITSTNYSVVLTRDILTNAMDAVHNMTDTNTFMTMVINRAIDYTKCSSGYILTPNLLTINITETIQWAVRIVSGKSRVPIVFEPLPRNICAYIITDKQWLIENILCLVSNATKFTMHGSVTIRCELQVEAVNGEEYICIEVEDTGIGIPEEMRAMMFRPFQQTMRMAGGTGLGLYSLHNRVDALKGTCGICDRRDGASGACVWFRIPYRCDTDAAAEYSIAEKRTQLLPTSALSFRSVTEGDIELGIIGISSEEKNRSGDCHPSTSHVSGRSSAAGSVVSDGCTTVDGALMTPRFDLESQAPTPEVQPSNTNKSFVVKEETVRQADRNCKHILLIDDSVIVRKSVSRALSAEGFIIDLAENGLMGLEMMQAKIYDLVLLDIQMPMMDGLEAAKRMRKFESEIPGRHQNIIGISAFSTDQVRNDALGAGMDGFIEKPFKVGALLDTCRSCGFPVD